VIDRASTFSQPEIVALLRTEFVPVAIDQAYQRRQQDAEGEFYRKIANQGPRPADGGTTQGRYVVDADGTLLGYNNNRDTERLLRLMRESLDRPRPEAVAAIEAGKKDARFSPEPPSDGLVVRVHSLVLGGYPETEDPWLKIFQEGMGRDNLWIRGDEHEALRRGEFPDSLVVRLACFHLVDNTRGEPPMWKAEEIRERSLEFRDGRLSGRIHLASADGSREFRADLLGFVASEGGRVTRFDLVAKGSFRGESPLTRNAPPGEFPLGVSFRLADGGDPADAIPPQGSRGWIDGYLRDR
jgi:hypothetical protein